MKYQNYVAMFGTDRSVQITDVAQGAWIHAMEEGGIGAAVRGYDSKEEAVRAAVSEAVPSTHTFVMVSRDTLKKLGVLDKIGTSVLGFSLPSGTALPRTTKEAFYDSFGSMTVKAPAPFMMQPSSVRILHVGGQRVNNSLSEAPLVLEVEDAFFGAGELSSHTPLSEFSVNTFVRLQAMLGDVVAQADTSPEVIAPEDDRFELLEAKDFAARLDATDQTVYNWEKAGRLISVLPPGRVRSRRYPAFQLSKRLNRPLHELAIAMYRSHEQDTTLYWDFLRSRHQDFGGSTGVDFLLNRVAEPGLVDLEESDRNDLFLSLAEEDMSRAIS
jgi:hypothetical protein